MIRNISVDSISPASYNPRRIDDSDFEKLCESVNTLGIIVPIIVNSRNGIIVAGHQRTKAAKAVGISEVPALFADGVSAADEVRFNQIHNGTDYDQGLTAKVAPFEATGFQEISPEDNTAFCENKSVVQEIAKLIERYGNVLSCVATMDGVIFKAPGYADACRVLGIPAHVYVVPRDKEAFAIRAFSKAYGVFCYEHLEKKTYVQGLAQMHRRTEKTKGKSKRTAKSKLYETMVIPGLGKADKTLDFGAGKGLYARLLKEDGYDITSLEFYHNDGRAIDVSAGKRDIEGVIKKLESDGLFDCVVMDSVLNSVDSLDAESAVMGSCSAMLKIGGTFYISGRPIERVKKLASLKKASGLEGKFYFPDEHGFTATFRRGQFYYQKFHSRQQVMDLAAAHGFEVVKYAANENSWQAKLKKVSEDDAADFGIDFEFSLPLPRGRYEYSERMMQAVSRARAME